MHVINPIHGSIKDGLFKDLFSNTLQNKCALVNSLKRLPESVDWFTYTKEMVKHKLHLSPQFH